MVDVQERVLRTSRRTHVPVNFDGVVFAGGGCRCFWQAGFYSEVAPLLGLQPKYLAAASAGASLAAASLVGLAPRALEVFRDIAASNPSNLHWRRAFSDQPVFPHANLFRQAILEVFDEEALHRLRTGPPLRVALTRPPSSPAGLVPSLLAGFAAYQLDRWLTGRIHSRWPERLGFQVEWAHANDCRDMSELCDLLLHTSCTPPFTPRLQREGRPVIDGGLTDNVPVAALPECERILVLLTRSFPSLPQSERVLYVQPSREIPVEKWDYTRPDGIEQAFALGQSDGREFFASYNRNLDAHEDRARA